MADVFALVIPVDGPLQRVPLAGDELAELQRLVGGGSIQGVPAPSTLADADYTAVYVNEEGKFRDDLLLNGRATEFMVPGVGIHADDTIEGPLVLVGTSPASGATRPLSQRVIDCVEQIEVIHQAEAAGFVREPSTSAEVYARYLAQDAEEAREFLKEVA